MDQNETFHIPYQYCDFYTDTLSLTDWGPVTHACVGNQTVIGSDNGLSPDRRQTITWTNIVNWALESKR